MAVSVWNSACASIRFGVTSCLGTVPVILSDFTHEQQLEVLRELFPFLVFPLQICSAGHSLWAVHSLHGKCFPSPSSPPRGCRLLASFVLLRKLPWEMCNYERVGRRGENGRNYHLWRNRNVSFLDHLVLVKVKNTQSTKSGLSSCWELCRHFLPS